MEKLEPNREDKSAKENRAEFLHNYEAKEEDFDVLIQSMERMFESPLFDKETIHGVRVATFDSKFLYLFSQEEHSSTAEYNVETIPIVNTKGIHGYRIPSVFLGKEEWSYGGAGAWLELPEIDSTAGENSTRVPNPKVLENKNEIVKVIWLAPKGGFGLTEQSKRYDYETDLLFHEMGHIEEMSLYHWPNKGQVSPFPQQKSLELFLSVINRSPLIFNALRSEVVKNITRASIGEMYAMMVDREAKRMFKKELIQHEDELFLQSLKKNETENKVDVDLSSPHVTGAILVRILEDNIQDFKERKEFAQGLLVDKEVNSIV